MLAQWPHILIIVYKKLFFPPQKTFLDMLFIIDLQILVVITSTNLVKLHMMLLAMPHDFDLNNVITVNISEMPQPFILISVT